MRNNTRGNGKVYMQDAESVIGITQGKMRVIVKYPYIVLTFTFLLILGKYFLIFAH